MKKYRITWVSLISGHQGWGEKVLSLDEAEDYCERLNSRYRGQIYHWVEEGEDGEQVPIPNKPKEQIIEK